MSCDIAALLCTALHCTFIAVLYCYALYSTVKCCAILYCSGLTVIQCTVYTVLYCVVLYGTFDSTALYCTALSSNISHLLSSPLSPPVLSPYIRAALYVWFTSVRSVHIAYTEISRSVQPLSVRAPLHGVCPM